VLAYSLDADCPWEVTNDIGDMVSYADFEDSWANSEGAIPGREAFSRLIQQLERRFVTHL